MKTWPKPAEGHEPSIAADIIVGTLGLLSQVVRIPVYAVLRWAAGPVRLVLGAAGVLSVCTAFLFQFAIDVLHPHFWGMLGFGIACGIALVLYDALLWLISR